MTDMNKNATFFISLRIKNAVFLVQNKNVKKVVCNYVHAQKRYLA